MKRLALPGGWRHYRGLPEHIQKLADQKFELLEANPRHPSLHFKKISGQRQEVW